MPLGVHDHPFYKPLWRRVAVVVTVALWAAFETFYAEDGLWTAISVATLGYSVWAFLVIFPKTKA